MKRGKIGLERREFPRFELPEGQLRAEFGVDDSRPTRAIVLDISRGGVKLDVPGDTLDRAIVGVCAVRFLNENNDVVPATSRGRIRRVDGGDGRHHVAIEFAQPLEFVGGMVAGIS